MIVKILEENEKNRIRNLYEEVFDDSKEFLDYYFGCYVKNTINFVCEDDGNIIGMATIHPKNLMISDEKVKAGYVYAVATKPEYRGKGIMRSILNAIEKYARANDYSYLYLIPADYKIYVGQGYKLLREKSEKKYKACDLSNVDCKNKTVVKVQEKDIACCIEFMEEFYKNNISIYYEESNLKEIINRLSINNSGIYCIFDTICDKILGLAFVEDDENANLIHLICHKNHKDVCIKLTMAALNKEELFYRINDIMFKEIHGNMEQLNDFTICINDEV